MIKFAWDAPTSGPVPTSYRLCINQVIVPANVPAVCTASAVVIGATEKSVDLDVTKVWYARVVSVNSFGESIGSDQVILGKPLPPQNLTGSL